MDRWLLTYHPASFAGLQVLLTALMGGATLISVSNPTVSALAVSAIDFGATLISGTPTLWRGLLVTMGADAAKIPVRHATLGGEACDQATLDLVHETFPKASISHIYASTEAGALFSVRDGKAGFPAAWLETEREGVELRIRNNLLEVKSRRAMVSYAVGERSPSGPDGWLNTGDIVRVQGDRVFFEGRTDGVINVGGAKVMPEEVETAVRAVRGVSDARVYGVKSSLTGSVVGIDVVLIDGFQEDLIRNAIRVAVAGLEPYKRPRIIKFIPAMDIGETGKKGRKIDG